MAFLLTGLPGKAWEEEDKVTKEAGHISVKIFDNTSKGCGRAKHSLRITAQ
jgi:hypothetical protein